MPAVRPEPRSRGVRGIHCLIVSALAFVSVQVLAAMIAGVLVHGYDNLPF